MALSCGMEPSGSGLYSAIPQPISSGIVPRQGQTVRAGVSYSGLFSSSSQR